MTDSSIGRRSRARLESSADAPHAALLIDFDNVTMGIRSDLQNQLRKLMNSDIIKGKVSVQRAYADWRRYPQYIVPLSEASIDLIFAPAFGANKKNATDIRLAIDALELIFTRPEIGTFILLSGDSDFSALVLKLKEYGKYVIGVGIRESSSDLLIQNCDEYYSYSELTGLAKESDLEHARRDPWELVVEAVQKMLHEGDVMRSDRLKQVMQAIDPKFDEKDAGFNRFSKFVVSAAERGLLSLNKMENGQYAIDLGANANVTVSEQAPAETGADESNGRKTVSRRRDSHKRGESETVPRALTLSESFDLLKQALLAAGAVGEESIDHEQARERMIGLRGGDSDPLFESRRFLRMLRQAHDADLIELIKSDGDRYLLKLSAVGAVGESPAEDAAAADEPAAAADEKKQTRKKARKTARRTTTRRSARGSTSGAPPEADTEPSGSDSGAAAGPEANEAEGAEALTSEAKGTKRKSRTSASRGQSTRRSTRSTTRTAGKSANVVESNSRPESPPAETNAAQKSARRNPRYRRGSRGSPPRPDREADIVAEQEPHESQSSDKQETTGSSVPQTSGRRSLRMRKGSRGGRATAQPEPTSPGQGVTLPASPSESTSGAPAEVRMEFSEPEATPSRDIFGDAVEKHEPPQPGFLGKIRAAIHKAVGGDPQMPGSEG